ncbi:related to Aldos-2-ulose dehydratase [Armillaria ostoyae]|uniref:Related to Aldos-2-ulose dehydratase n=1 Tax=Armillaria ostoyae TaxID=47428 RepID=A0A284REP4_ARMOS|nr:related to Aldos-2-ulose dehydratase [Armillaria ostoyae]
MHSFFPRIIDYKVDDGYWIEKFPFCTADYELRPNVIAYGLGTAQKKSDIVMYQNTYNPENGSPQEGTGWKEVILASLSFPVPMAYTDITGDGYNDIIIADNYGSSMDDDIWPDGGRIQWFENPGDPNKEHWKPRYIGQSPGMHRIRVGHFTQKDVVQIAALPVITRSGDFDTPVPVIIYTKPDDPRSASKWEKDIPFDNLFRVVHEAIVVPSPDDGGLDRIMLASREGISFLWFSTSTKKWEYKILGTGLPQISDNPYWGSGSVSVGRVHNDHTGYIASSEAMHGHFVSVYVKDENAPSNQPVDAHWTRHVLDNYSLPSSGFSGTIHQVVCADIDGDGVDEVLVAMMGSAPPSWNQTGVWCYKPVDLKNGIFSKFKLSDVSAGRIAVANFRSRHILDFATISYSVPGYFESPLPLVMLYEATPITAEKLNGEVVFHVPRPAEVHVTDEVAFLDVAGCKLALVVVPPLSQHLVRPGECVKVIDGQVFWTDQDGGAHERTQAPAPWQASTIMVDAKDSKIFTRQEGAIFILVKDSISSGKPPFTDMSQVIARNIFPLCFPDAVRHATFPWVKVADRPWANGRFEGLEFYNLVGFHVRYGDDSAEAICHIQLWTAGVNVSAGFHNHTGQGFAEIHACLVNGTGKGGMSWATVADGDFDPANPDESKYSSVVVPSMSEHGPLWRTNTDGMPLFRNNGTLDYPWHAWIAGNGDPNKQRFDVWMAFEFSPFVARAIHSSARTPEPGRYRLISTKTAASAVIKDGNSRDGVPLVVVPPQLSARNQIWELVNITGTDSWCTLKNVSYASSDWPIVRGQRLIGTRSLAMLGITSSWRLIPADGRTFRIGLINTDLVWSVDHNYNIVLTAGEGDSWIFEKVGNRN